MASLQSKIKLSTAGKCRKYGFFWLLLVHNRGVHFATSGVAVFPLLPPLVAFAISLVTTTGGLSGAFLLLPFQMSVLGFTSPAVSATNHLYNVVAIPSGVVRFWREGRLVWPLVATVVVGTLPGVLLGTLVRVRFLPQPQHFKVFVGFVLLYIGGRLLGDLLGQGGRPSSSASPPTPVRVLRSSWTQVSFEFAGQQHRFRTAPLVVLALVVGLIGGTYGIGGGAIIAPFLVSVFRLPVYTVAGAALLGTFVTSLTGVLFFQALAPLFPGQAVAPDWPLGVLFGLGGMAGTYCGARLQKHVPERVIKGMLALVLLSLGARYVLGAFS